VVVWDPLKHLGEKKKREPVRELEPTKKDEKGRFAGGADEDGITAKQGEEKVIMAGKGKKF